MLSLRSESVVPDRISGPLSELHRMGRSLTSPAPRRFICEGQDEQGEITTATVEPRALPRVEDPPGREFHELWFALAERDWRSLVLVPTDAGSSAAAAAASLASVGNQMYESPVTTFFTMEAPGDYRPAVQSIHVARTAEMARRAPLPGNVIDHASEVHFVATAASTLDNRAPHRTGRMIVAIQPVVVEPLGLAVTQAADLVVLYVEKGRSRLASVRRTVQLVGRERIAGCFLDSAHDRSTPRDRAPAP